MENEKIPREVQDSINARAVKYFEQDPFIGLSRKEAEEMSYISGAVDQYRLTVKSRWKRITESSDDLSALAQENERLKGERDEYENKMLCYLDGLQKIYAEHRGRGITQETENEIYSLLP